MNNFTKNNRFGGGGFSRGGKSFGRSGGKDFGRNNEMHETTCADCKKSCEVPFKPNGMKPVYCKDCFGKNGGQVSSGNDFSKKSFNKPAYNSQRSAPSSYSHSSQSKPQYQNDDRKSDGLSKQLEAMNAKFDKLISLTETLILKTEPKKAEKAEKPEKTEKIESKKVSKKK